MRMRCPGRTAAAGLWPQTLFGGAVIALLAWKAPTALWWGLPLLAGFPLAIPFAVVTASPAFGEAAGALAPLRHSGGDRHRRAKWRPLAGVDADSIA